MVVVSAAAAARPRFPRSRPSMASAAGRAVVGAVSPPARVPVLAASLWPPRVLALERAVVLSLPRAPVQPLAVALTPWALALQRAVVLMPREPPRVLAFVPTRALVLQGPY